MPFPRQLPPDINAEVLMNYYPEGTMKVMLRGMHKRNTYCDVIEMEDLAGGTAFQATIGRRSLYNVLPEFMFHPVDRFDNLTQNDAKSAFYEQVQEQEKEKENAFQFFAPMDALLLRLKAQIRTSIEKYTDGNVLMQQIIGDHITQAQKENRFIRQVIPYLPLCKTMRGNRTLLTFMLRKVFMEEGLRLNLHQKQVHLHETETRYENETGMILGEGYLGEEFDDLVPTYDIYYWSDKECTTNFQAFVDEVEALRQFVQNYFLSVEAELCFKIQQDTIPLRLGDETCLNYLNYNTNL